MSHPKITQTRTFTDDFTEILSLTKDQVDHINELTYLFLKEYTFSIDPDYKYEKANFRYMLAIARTLTNSQKTEFKKIIEEQKRHIDKNDFETYKNQRYLQKYKALKLSEDRYDQFKSFLNDAEELVIKRTEEIISCNQPRKPYHYRFKEVANEILHGFLTPKELITFNQIEEEDYQAIVDMRTDVIMNSYANSLHLDRNQAKQMFYYEENEPVKDKYGEYYNEWEKLELYQEFMKSILTETQFKKYIPTLEERKNSIDEGIIHQNEQTKQKVERLINRKTFLQNNYLPALCKQRSSIDALLNEPIKQELPSLRKLYYEKIVTIYRQHKKEAIHHYKDLFPNHMLELEIELQLRALIPNATYLGKTQDFISKIPNNLRNVILTPTKSLKESQIALNKFEIENYENTGGTYGGWIKVIRPTKDEQFDSIQILSTLLLYPKADDNINQINLVLNLIK